MVKRGVILAALRRLVLSPPRAVRLQYRRLNRCRPCKVLVVQQRCRRYAVMGLEPCPGETSSNAVLCLVGLVAWPDSEWEGLVVVPKLAGRLGQEWLSLLSEALVREGQVTLGLASSWG